MEFTLPVQLKIKKNFWAPLKIDDRGSRQGARVRKTAVYWV